jgi:serine/threonine-protein kinase
MLPGAVEPPRLLTIGRYALFDELAAGGMATVHIGRLRGTAGFKRTVAIKRLHQQFARDPEFVASFLDEAQLVARIQHPNVVPVLDVVAEAGELFMVMEYVHGESLASLLRAANAKGVLPKPAVVAQILTGLLYGLEAAHDARSDRGVPLRIVHRDVSPQNVLVGADGVARVLDFGVAKASQKVQETTKEGVVKGKLAYMPPEQLDAANAIDRRVDVYAAGVVFWEALTGRRLYENAELGPMIARILAEPVPPPSRFVQGLPPGLDEIVLKAVAKDASERYATAVEMAHAIERILPPVAPREVGEWVKSLVGERLTQRAEKIAATEKLSLPPPPDGRTSIHEIIEDGKRASRPDLQRAQTPSQPLSIAPGSRPGVDVPTSTQVMFDVPARRPASGKQLGLVLAAVGVLVAVGGAFTIVALRHGSGAREGDARSAAMTAPPPSASAEPPPPSLEIVEIPVAVDAAAPAAPSATAAPKPAAAKKRCDPPWTTDARGVRVIKRECL